MNTYILVKFFEWLYENLTTLFIINIIVIIFLLIFFIVRINKDIKKLQKDKRKIERKLLKFLSNKKNKTY